MLSLNLNGINVLRRSSNGFEIADLLEQLSDMRVCQPVKSDCQIQTAGSQTALKIDGSFATVWTPDAVSTIRLLQDLTDAGACSAPYGRGGNGYDDRGRYDNDYRDDRRGRGGRDDRDDHRGPGRPRRHF